MGNFPAVKRSESHSRANGSWWAGAGASAGGAVQGRRGKLAGGAPQEGEVSKGITQDLHEKAQRKSCCRRGRAKISRQVEQAQQELKNATDAATLKSCVKEQRRLYTKDLEFQKTTAFARLLLAAIKGDSMHKLLKLLALTDDVVSSASSIIPDLTPRDVTSHAAKVLFPSWKAPPPPSSDVLAGEGPVRKRQREEAEIASMPRRAVPILHVACALNKAACLELLLSLGVPANWNIEGYIMPIHIACHLRYIECCRILIAAGAAVEARNAQVRSLW
jgi:hypothetical protein